MSLGGTFTLVIWLAAIPNRSAVPPPYLADSHLAARPLLRAPAAQLPPLGAIDLDTAGMVADDAICALFTRVRSTEEFVRALVRQGCHRSRSFRALIDTLQDSNIIVFVQPGFCAGGRIRACLVSVDGSSRDRHIRIKLDSRRSNWDGLIAAVAHELQHAVEIAEHIEVIDASGAILLYRRLAFGRCRQGLSEECETARAIATERRVLGELWQERAQDRSARRQPDCAPPTSFTARPPAPSSAARSPVKAGSSRPW